jgi:hypothetical protein
MNILVCKEAMDDLEQCVERNIDFLSTVVTFHVSNDELSAKMDEKLQEILYYFRKAYNPRLIELKKQARTYYQKWLTLKKTDASTANAVYLEYLQLKCKITQMEIPF